MQICKGTKIKRRSERSYLTKSNSTYKVRHGFNCPVCCFPSTKNTKLIRSTRTPIKTQTAKNGRHEFLYHPGKITNAIVCELCAIKFSGADGTTQWTWTTEGDAHNGLGQLPR